MSVYSICPGLSAIFMNLKSTETTWTYSRHTLQNKIHNLYHTTSPSAQICVNEPMMPLGIRYKLNIRLKLESQ